MIRFARLKGRSLLRRALRFLAAVGLAGFGSWLSRSFRIRPTVLTPRGRPARVSVGVILFFPIVGQSTFSRMTMCRRNRGIG